jgi:hypothetical protein
MLRRAVTAPHTILVKQEVLMDDRDIYRSAKALIDQHGNDATIHAAMRADELLDEGDLDGAATWRRGIQAIKKMETTEPSGSVH